MYDVCIFFNFTNDHRKLFSRVHGQSYSGYGSTSLSCILFDKEKYQAFLEKKISKKDNLT